MALVGFLRNTFLVCCSFETPYNIYIYVLLLYIINVKCVTFRWDVGKMRPVRLRLISASDNCRCRVRVRFRVRVTVRVRVGRPVEVAWTHQLPVVPDALEQTHRTHVTHTPFGVSVTRFAFLGFIFKTNTSWRSWISGKGIIVNFAIVSFYMRPLCCKIMQ